MRSYEIYGDWEEHDGKIVEVDGRKYRLDIDVINGKYGKEIGVYAERIYKGKDYKEIKEKLGDDWVTDVLESDITWTVKVQNALKEV